MQTKKGPMLISLLALMLTAVVPGRLPAHEDPPHIYPGYYVRDRFVVKADWNTRLAGKLQNGPQRLTHYRICVEGFRHGDHNHWSFPVCGDPRPMTLKMPRAMGSVVMPWHKECSQAEPFKQIRVRVETLLRDPTTGKWSWSVLETFTIDLLNHAVWRQEGKSNYLGWWSAEYFTEAVAEGCDISSAVAPVTFPGLGTIYSDSPEPEGPIGPRAPERPVTHAREDKSSEVEGVPAEAPVDESMGGPRTPSGEQDDGLRPNEQEKERRIKQALLRLRRGLNVRSGEIVFVQGSQSDRSLLAAVQQNVSAHAAHWRHRQAENRVREGTDMRISHSAPGRREVGGPPIIYETTNREQAPNGSRISASPENEPKLEAEPHAMETSVRNHGRRPEEGTVSALPIIYNRPGIVRLSPETSPTNSSRSPGGKVSAYPATYASRAEPEPRRGPVSALPIIYGAQAGTVR